MEESKEKSRSQESCPETELKVVELKVVGERRSSGGQRKRFMEATTSGSRRVWKVGTGGEGRFVESRSQG